MQLQTLLHLLIGTNLAQALPAISLRGTTNSLTKWLFETETIGHIRFHMPGPGKGPKRYSSGGLPPMIKVTAQMYQGEAKGAEQAVAKVQQPEQAGYIRVRLGEEWSRTEWPDGLDVGYKIELGNENKRPDDWMRITKSDVEPWSLTITTGKYTALQKQHGRRGMFKVRVSFTMISSSPKLVEMAPKKSEPKQIDDSEDNPTKGGEKP